LKVAFVTSFPQDPGRPHGGVEAVSVNLIEALAKFDDLEINVITTDRACSSPTTCAWNGATIHRLPWTSQKVLGHVLGDGRRSVRRCLETIEPDLIHAHDIYGLMVKGLATPRVFTIHGFIHADTEVAGERLAWLRSRIWRRLETAGWADQPHIVSISPYVRGYITGIARGVIHDIDNPIAEACFHIKRQEQKGTLFSAALMCPRKNTLGLLKAFDRLISAGVDARLRLAGKAIDPDYERQVIGFIQSHRLTDRINLLGAITAYQVREELAHASVFALVSLEEGAPMGVAEAMAAAVPVVTSNRCGMPYMVRNGETGYLIDPDNPDEIAARLEHLLRSDDLRADMGQKARLIAEDRFHPARVAEKTREVYYAAIRNH